MNYTPVNVPLQSPERVVYPHEVTPPRECEVSRPSPTEAATSWSGFHKQVPPQAGVL